MNYLHQETAHSKLKCPKCKSLDLTLFEHWTNSSIEWDQENGAFSINQGTLHSDGNPFKVTAQCVGCKHGWTVRKAASIHDIII